MEGKRFIVLIYSRALAKETDGDFTKFVQKTAKPRDMAQKWRAFKNISRFFKNPFGYTFWKFSTLQVQNRVRLVYVLLFWHLYQSTMLYLVTKKKKEGMIANWRWMIGENNKHYDSPHMDRRFPVDRKKNYVRYSNFHQVRKNKRTSMIHTNWWCRDQVFRKYFQMRKKHDIKPSLSGFYHEPIADQTMKTNQAFADLRASRASK